MKLKKIASLMLAGVMAVSMLAGCNTSSSTGSGASSVDNSTQTSSFASVLNAKLSANQAALLSFSSSSKLASALEWMNGTQVDNLLVTDGLILAAGRPTLLDPDDGAAGEAVVTRIAQTYDGTPVAVTATNEAIGVEANTNASYLYIYMVDGSVTSTEKVADYILNGTDGLQKMVYSVVGAVDDNTTNHVDYEYDGQVEVIQISNSNSTDTAWVVAVLINQYATTNT